MPVARGLRPIPTSESVRQHNAYKSLGVTAVDKDAYVAQAFHAGLEFRQTDGPRLLEAFRIIVGSRQSESLQMTEGEARSTGLYSETDLDDAYRLIGVKPDERAFVAETDVVDAFNRTLDGAASGDVRRHSVLEAFNLIARHTESQLFTAVLESRNEPVVTEPTLDEAYRAFNLAADSHGVDDELLTAMYEASLNEPGASVDKLKAALAVIARERNSAVLKRYIETGAKRASVVAESASLIAAGINEYEEQPVASDRPVGLQKCVRVSQRRS